MLLINGRLRLRASMNIGRVEGMEGGSGRRCRRRSCLIPGGRREGWMEEEGRGGGWVTWPRTRVKSSRAADSTQIDCHSQIVSSYEIDLIQFHSSADSEIKDRSRTIRHLENVAR